MSINLLEFHNHIVKPTLAEIGLGGLAAERLVTGTAVTESLLRHLVQTRGIALGFFQMEPATHTDIWDNFLQYRKPIADKVLSLTAPQGSMESQLVTNLAYATAMCRVHYLRVRDPLPNPDNLQALARYWKRWYNTPLGKGTEADFMSKAVRIMDLE